MIQIARDKDAEARHSYYVIGNNLRKESPALYFGEERKDCYYWVASKGDQLDLSPRSKQVKDLHLEPGEGPIDLQLVLNR